METKASYILVGLFVLGLIGGGVAYALWLVEPKGEAPVYYVVRFDGDVTGLSVGSDVRFHGVRVGEVSAIRITGEPEQVEVTIKVNRGTPVRRSTVARLEMQGITGGTFLQLHSRAGAGAAAGADELLPGATRPPYPEIPSELSEIQQVFKKFPLVLGQIESAARQLADLLNQKNLDEIGASLENISRVTENLSRQTDALTGIFGKVDTTLDRAQATLDAVEKLATHVDGAVGDVKKGVNAFERVTTHLDQFIEENRRPVSDFSSTGLYEMTQFLVEARSLVQSLNRITAKFESDPARFLFGDPHRGYAPR